MWRASGTSSSWPEKLAVLGAAIARRWPGQPPVQTLLGVARLALPEMSFEVDAVGQVPKDRR
jgi:enamine deaminase RidA (YjgF/YER057c/UK114 family)